MDVERPFRVYPVTMAIWTPSKCSWTSWPMILMVRNEYGGARHRLRGASKVGSKYLHAYSWHFAGSRRVRYVIGSKKANQSRSIEGAEARVRLWVWIRAFRLRVSFLQLCILHWESISTLISSLVIRVQMQKDTSPFTI